MSASFYTERYEPSFKPTLSCATDGTFLRVSSDHEYEVALRYDTVEFWVHPAALNFETLSRLSISLTGQPEAAGLIPANARFPVAVRRSKSRLLVRMLVTALGALLVALPAILGPSTLLQIRIVSALLGAMLLAVSSVALGSTKG